VWGRKIVLDKHVIGINLCTCLDGFSGRDASLDVAGSFGLFYLFFKVVGLLFQAAGCLECVSGGRGGRSNGTRKRDRLSPVVRASLIYKMA